MTDWMAIGDIGDIPKLGARVTCPLHNWSIELETGLAAAPDEGATACYPVRVEKGVVYIRIEKAAAQQCA